MILDGDAIRGLVPHRGEMCLLESVESWDREAIVCTTTRHLAAHNPLRRGGRLSAVHAIEFAAQAAAVHASLNTPTTPQPRGGLLVSVRHCTFHCDSLDDIPGPLRIEIRLAAGGGAFATYDFSVASPARVLAEGRLGLLVETGSSR